MILFFLWLAVVIIAGLAIANSMETNNYGLGSFGIMFFLAWIIFTMIAMWYQCELIQAVILKP